MKERVLVGLSGGLDSTYTALQYRERGYDVIGAVLRMSAETDIAGAQTAAEQVGIPLAVIDAQDAFERYVMQYFAAAYANGETPNPCVMCNRYVKIALLCEYAEQNGIARVSTGHYAQIVQDADHGRWFVRAAEDRRKDQSYVLWQLTQKQLSMLETPLAAEDKTLIREDAKKRGLSAAGAKESQDICFLPDGNYVPFVEARMGAFPPGDFIDENGQCVGRHAGIIRYTVGQRKGLGIALGHPVFVTKIRASDNTVHLAPAGMEYGGEMQVHRLNFQRLAPEALVPGLRVTVKIRYAAKPAAAVIAAVGEDCVTVRFDSPQRAVTPGQSAVFYDEARSEDVLFGGLIAQNAESEN